MSWDTLKVGDGLTRICYGPCVPRASLPVSRCEASGSRSLAVACHNISVLARVKDLCGVIDTDDLQVDPYRMVLAAPNGLENTREFGRVAEDP